MFEEKKQYLKSYLLQESKINRLKFMIIKKPEYKNDLKKEIEIAKRKRKKIEEKIFAVDDILLSELLFQKYILGLSLEKISCNINYSKRQTERLHRKALEIFKM